nr:MAG TPA: hypothetical protein [Caudoviricetes sp.]
MRRSLSIPWVGSPTHCGPPGPMHKTEVTS